jgi:predicted Zn-ribbon and HTH transcriptional regulator
MAWLRRMLKSIGEHMDRKGMMLLMEGSRCRCASCGRRREYTGKR